MGSLKDKSIKFKLFLPILFGSILITVALLGVSRYYYMRSHRYDTEKLISGKVDDMRRYVDALEQQALFSASVCAQMDLVKQAYAEYYKSGDLEKSSLIIENQFTNIDSVIKQNTGISARIHFHLPPARSFIRCWEEKRGDDISAFRNTVLQVSKTHKAVSGIETGRGGFVLRGIAPIFSDSGEFYGSVEVFYGIDKIVEQITSGTDQEFAIFMHTDYLDIATKLLADTSTNIDSKNKKIGDFILVQKTDSLHTGFLNAKVLRLGTDSLYIFENQEHKLAVFPIKNYSGVTEGVGILQLDISDFKDNMTTAGIGIVGTTSALILFMLIFTVLFINMLIIKRIDNVRNTLGLLSEGKPVDLIDAKNSDEIGKMVSLSNQLNTRLSRLSAVADEIGKGNFTTEFEPASAEDKLGIAVVNMKNSLKSYAEDLEEKVRVRTAELNKKTEELMLKQHEIQEKNEELNQQNEEIITINDNLISQRAKIEEQQKILSQNEQAMREKNEELNQQNEEITTINETLQEKSKLIENQNQELAKKEQILAQNNFKLENTLALLTTQMQHVEQKNRDITGSLNYASRIQKAVLGSAEHISNAFAEAFVFFEPHSIVSGDFYWYHEIQSENIKILITADCTGHGVPGAFMTVIGHNFLDEIVIGNQVFEPSEILYKLDEKVKKTLKRNIGNEKVNDGMDLSVLVFDTTTNCLKYAGAKSSVFIFRGDYHREIKGSVFPIGGNDMRKKAEKKFETIVAEVQKNDMIYTFSDGFQDQFGGEKNRKYLKSRFRDFLLQISGKPVDTQKQAVETEITAWRGQNPQTDDMLIIGIRI